MVIYLVIIAGGIEGHVNIYRHVLLTMVWVELAATFNTWRKDGRFKLILKASFLYL